MPSWSRPTLCASLLVSAASQNLGLAGKHVASTASSPRGQESAFVHLFEWSWDDVAKECEDFLGPKGFTAVQVSPPMEHVQGDAWWTRYQPVSYKLVSRSGDEVGFQSMVLRCANAGVGIYADAVFNHMAAGSGTGVNGTQYGGRSFSGLYGPENFHHNQGDSSRNCGVNNYQDQHEVQYCDLVGLPDLCTGCPDTQQKVADYINGMLDMGIAGLRIDAAKHMEAGELGNLLSKVKGNAWRFMEVIGAQGEPVKPSQYYGIGQVTEFNYASQINSNFKADGKLQYFENFGESWGLMPTSKAVVFIDNHDTQRNSEGASPLTYKDGKLYELATIFMLAHPYGYPKIMSSYSFNNKDQGPPTERVHQGSGTVNCGADKGWQCEHRRTAIANMVAWRKAAGMNWVGHFEAHGGDQIVFCRGDNACIALNRSGQRWDAEVKVSMPPGTYCNVANSDSPDSCEKVVVGSDGMAKISVDSLSAVAFHTGARVSMQEAILV